MKRQFSWITTAICVLSLSVPGISLGAQQAKPPKAKAHVQKNKANKASKPPKHANKGKHTGQGQGASGDLMRFQGLDKNRDGIITRSEWQGDDRAFANHDWDGNGFLSGDEVRPGATKPKTRGKK
jgi:hypothetical protein